MIEKVERSVRANNGNQAYVKGMLKAGATDTKKYRCAAAYIWYSIKQDPKTGESPYTDLAKWLDRAPTWAHNLATAKGESGAIERKKIMELIGDVQKTLHPRLVEACQTDLDSFEAEQLKYIQGSKHPNFG